MNLPESSMMKKLLAALLATTLFCGIAQADSLFRWTDENGRVHYSDAPPPPDIRKVEERMLKKGSQIETDKQSYATRKASEAFPVSLYTAEKCPACEPARKYLSTRGIPFSETKITTQEQATEAAKLIGEKEAAVPLLVVGGKPYKGYSESEWASALDVAGYPKGK
ncbi:glutaredoxin family protein [Niveibacterium sp. SC-1]|uniref:glutaredoxin family protein n=1 Tax=Niveibacterium sp. SC-1 TaxID=3135646 RepID=UPI00311D48CD